MDEGEMIHDFVATAAGPSARSRNAARAALQAQIVRESEKGTRRRALRWKRLLPTALAAAILAAGSLFAVSPLLRGDQQTPAVAAVLHSASQVASLRPAHYLRPGEYAYTKSVGAYFDQQDRQGHTWGALVRTTREIWIGADGTGRIRQRSATPVFLAPGDRARWEQAGSPPITELSSGETYDRRFARLGPPLEIEGFHQNQLLRLANNPDALRDAIRAAAEKTQNPLGYEMLTIVGDLLRESVAPPRLRASLYQVAADIPGIELVGTVTDRAGRRGTAVSASRGDTRLELIFDPRTSVLLAMEEALVHRIPDTAAPSGTVLAYTLYLNSSITRSLSAP